jgi:hypothetical protein
MGHDGKWWRTMRIESIAACIPAGNPHDICPEMVIVAMEIMEFLIHAMSACERCVPCSVLRDQRLWIGSRCAIEQGDDEVGLFLEPAGDLIEKGIMVWDTAEMGQPYRIWGDAAEALDRVEPGIAVEFRGDQGEGGEL